MTGLRREWLCLLLAALLTGTVSTISLDDLDDLVLNHPDEFCLVSDCLGQYTAETCPQGTRWIEGVTMGGCCGACVSFMQESETVCTGKVDPSPCYQKKPDCTQTIYTGYGTCDEVGVCPNVAAKSRRATTDVRGEKQQPLEERPLSVSDLNEKARSQKAMRHGRDGTQLPMLVAEEHKQFLQSLMPVGEGQVENILQSSWCDYGMYCRADQCKIEPNWVTCINTQEGFDRDTKANNYVVYRDNYRWRPTCSSDGNYAPKQCKGYFDDTTRACECVDPSGSPIPGKALKFQGSLYTDMNCLCSRRVYERELAGETGLTLHCEENGNFEPLQCEQGWCYCVHPENGTTHGYQMPENALNLLPCYNRTLVGDLYLRQCDSMSSAYNTLTKLMINKGIELVPTAAANCNYDGSYASMQCLGIKCSCVNRFMADCLNDGSLGCECTKDQLTYAANGESYDKLNCVQLKGSYETNQELSSRDAVYRVDTQGNMISAVVRMACKGYLQQSKLEQCQKVGNIEDSLFDDGRKYCDTTCADGTELCPPTAYLFNSVDYTESDTCLDV